MNTFLWKGTDPKGSRGSVRISADNAQAGRQTLAEQGWSDLQLVTDEVCDNAGRTVQGPGSTDDVLEQLSPDAQLALFEGAAPGFWSEYGKALLKAKTSLVICSLALAWGIYAERKWSLVFGAVGIGLICVLFPLIHFFFSLPLHYYMRLNRAKVWSRWDEVLFCVNRLRQTHRLTRMGVGKVELARCRAQALAAKGHLEAGLAEFAGCANDPTLPRWNYMSFLASIYEAAKEHEKALECRRAAAAEKSDTSALWIDLSYGLVRGLNFPAEAREALRRAEELEITALAIPYVSFLRGIICWREGNFAEAREHLEKALPGFKSYEHNPLVEGLVLLCKSYLCAVCGALGELDLARGYFRETEQFLKAGREAELLEACRLPLSASPVAVG
jgi:tetratricopeptide (TPR) repeat protein